MITVMANNKKDSRRKTTTPSIVLKTILSFLDQIILLSLIAYYVYEWVFYGREELGWVIGIFLMPLFILEVTVLLFRYSRVTSSQKNAKSKDNKIAAKGLSISVVIFVILIALSLVGPWVIPADEPDPRESNELYNGNSLYY